MPPRTIEWTGELDGCAKLIDQTKLPRELTFLEIRTSHEMFEAIRRLSVRGAPAIGIAGAMGAVLAIRDFTGSPDELRSEFKIACDHLVSARPTAVNLAWGLDRMRRVARQASTDIEAIKQALLAEAKAIRDEDEAMCRAIGAHGESLIKDGCGVLTHCNAGSLATARFGTALAPVYVAHNNGRPFRVYADETRPLLQGSRLTAWELGQAGIDVTVLCDNMAASLMKSGRIDIVITGADRIAANGDVANKIGTYGVALWAAAHQIPMYVAAPSSTFDFDLEDGRAIPIEHRSEDEIRRGFGSLTAPADVACYCPAFDVTPAGLIRGFITDRGRIDRPSREKIAALLT